MNQLTLTGTLTTDVEVQHRNGIDQVSMVLASTYRSRTGDLCTAHPEVQVFNGLSRSLACLGRGSLVTVCAHLEDDVREPGTACSRHSEIVADRVEILKAEEPLRPRRDDPLLEETQAA
jgi:hypothetical protein